MSSVTARAWPHFVPRIELDAELKSIQEYLEEIFKRLDGSEAQEAELAARLEEFCTSQRQEVATRLAETEERVQHEVSSLRDELRHSIEDVRACTAAEANVRERMHELHKDQLAALGRDIAASNREVKDLDMSVRAVPSQYVKKYEHKEACEQLQLDSASKHADVRSLLVNLEATSKATHGGIHSAHGELCRKHDSLEHSASMLSSQVQAMQRDLEQLSRRRLNEEAMDHSLEALKVAVADLERQVRSAATDRSNIRTDLHHDHEVLRKTLFNFQGSMREVLEAIEQFHRLDAAGVELKERCDRHDKDFATLDARENSHWEACTAAFKEHEQSHWNLQHFSKGLQQELTKHVNSTRERTEQLKQQNVTLSLEQLDKAMGLHRSITEVERGHQELHDVVRNIHLPRL